MNLKAQSYTNELIDYSDNPRYINQLKTQPKQNVNGVSIYVLNVRRVSKQKHMKQGTKGYIINN